MHYNLPNFKYLTYRLNSKAVPENCNLIPLVQEIDKIMIALTTAISDPFFGLN